MTVTLVDLWLTFQGQIGHCKTPSWPKIGQPRGIQCQCYSKILYQVPILYFYFYCYNIFIGTVIHTNYAAFILLSEFAVISKQTSQDLVTWHSDAFYKIINSNFSPVSLTYIWSRSWPTSNQLILFLNSHSWMEPIRNLPLVEAWWGHVVATTCYLPPSPPTPQSPMRFHHRGTLIHAQFIHPSICLSIHSSIGIPFQLGKSSQTALITLCF